MINQILDNLGKHIDAFLMSCLLFTLMLGLFVIYSASAPYLYKQMINIVVALSCMWAVANIAPHQLQRLAMPLYVLGVLLLLAVALFGYSSKGAQRWLNIGFTKIQPSELMRIAVPMMLAWYFANVEGKLAARHFVIGSLLLLAPVILIKMQPDLGTAILILASGFYILYLAGLNWKFLAGSSLSLAIITPILYIFRQPLLETLISHGLLHGYQRKRIEILLGDIQDPLGAGYNTMQSIIAVGSGGMDGKGWLNGTQTQLDFLPEHHTDFIFAVFSEEFGLIGNLLLLSLFSLIIMRGLYIASTAQSTFTRLLAGSITLTFFTYAFVNMGMVSGILPVVGVPLPLISYGGTSMVTLAISFGILMSIHSHNNLAAT
ncbi:MAG: rod shape-determining protein RodA [Methylophilaceae bacterium]